MSADIKQDIANEAVRIVTGARRAAYGKPERNFERIALLWQAWFDARGIIMVSKSVLEEFDHHNAIIDEATVRLGAGDVSPLMRLMKEARLAETPDHRDSYVDLVGYALCGAEVAGVSTETEAAVEEIISDIGNIDRASNPYWVNRAAEPAPLQIEAGKYYRTRDGRKVGPMAYRPDGEWVWCAGMEEWRADGSWAPRRGDPDDRDLVAEWADT